MVRTLTSGMQTAIAAQGSEIAHLLVMVFDGGTVRLTDAAHDIDYGGNTYTAFGGLLRFEAIQESPDFDSQGLDLEIDGVDQTIIAELLADKYIGRLATLYRVHFGADGLIVSDPVTLFVGYMNNAWEVEEKFTPDGVGYCTVKTRFSSPMAKFDQWRGIRADTQSHQHAIGDDTDTFMRHIAALPEGNIGWVSEERY